MPKGDKSTGVEESLPAVAIVGRPNVGKSSLINMLTDRKALAKVSGKPGKTQLINHFEINDQHLSGLKYSGASVGQCSAMFSYGLMLE